MSHKVHPKIYRIRELKDWNTRGFYGKNMAQYLEEDIIIKDFLREKLKTAGVESIEIERAKDRVIIIVNTSRPGLVIGRGGEGVEGIKRGLVRKLLKKKKVTRKNLPQMKIEIREVRNPWVSPSLVAQWMAEQIERRTPYRQVLKRALNKVMANKEVKGARVEVAGRLNGLEIARTEWLKSGRLPRQTLRADIDYAFKEAYCRYGVIGIKVWIYKGEKTKE